MLCLAFGHLVAFPVQYTNRVVLSGPIDPHEKQKRLAHWFSSDTKSLGLPWQTSSLYWRSDGANAPQDFHHGPLAGAQLLTRHSRSTQGSAGHSRRVAELLGLIAQLNSLAQRVQGSAPLLSRFGNAPLQPRTSIRLKLPARIFLPIPA